MNKVGISKYIVGCLLLVLVIFGLQNFYGRNNTKQYQSAMVADVPVQSPSPKIFTISPSPSEPSPEPSPVMSPAQTPPVTAHLSLNEIFNEDHTWLQKLSPEKLHTLVVTGDVLTARSVNYKNVANNNFTRIFEKTADVLKAADLAFINLETPLTPDCKPTNEGMSFCGDVRSVQGLTYAGIDVASLANNHAGNQGKAGVTSTADALSKSGILPIGTLDSGAAYKEVGGQKFALLGYNDIGTQPGVAPAEEARIKQEITEAKQQADTVVVMFHWGVEYVTQPNDRQRSLARLAIDSGADLVVSNHPHWIQPIEMYNGKIIAYALGNFVFDQTWSQKTQEGVVARFTYYENQLIDLEFLPVQISGSGQPTFMTGTNKTRILNEMKTASEVLSKR